MPGNIKTEGLDGLGAEYLGKMTASIPVKRIEFQTRSDQVFMPRATVRLNGGATENVYP